MSTQQRFTLLRKLLKALGLSDDRVEELSARIQEWLLDDQAKKDNGSQFPYLLRDDFLSPAELNFYRVLQTAVSDWAIIFTKVSLGDLFYAQTGNRGQNQAYRNKIDRKHVDFLLCDPQTVRPILGIELDDKSHLRAERQERDKFVNQVFAAANLPLAHIPVKHGYPTEKLNRYLRQKAGVIPNLHHDSNEQIGQDEVNNAPSCPKCGVEMVKRIAKSGANAGNSFWGCPNYPKCRGIVNIPAE